MKIKKGSAIKGDHDFVCENCKAEFTASEGEYEVKSYDKYVGYRSHFFKNPVNLYVPTWSLSCKCPECKWIVKKEFPTGEPQYEQEVYD